MIVCVILHMCSLCECVSVPTKGCIVVSVFNEQQQKASHGEEMGYHTEIFNRVLHGIKSLAPTDPN